MFKGSKNCACFSQKLLVGNDIVPEFGSLILLFALTTDKTAMLSILIRQVTFPWEKKLGSVVVTIVNTSCN